MPLYEYECDACGHRFEVIQKFSDAPVETCPRCGGKVHKLMSSPAIQFKGTGWYVTDYAKKGQGGSATSGGKASGDQKGKGKNEGAAPSTASPAADGGSTGPAGASSGAPAKKD